MMEFWQFFWSTLDAFMDCFVKMKVGSMLYLVIWGTKSNIADIIWQFYWYGLIECMNCFVKYESLLPAPFGYVEKEMGIHFN